MGLVKFTAIKADDAKSSEYVKMKDLVGKLLAFIPLEYKQDVPTKFGAKDAVIADIFVIAGTNSETHYSQMILQGRLIGTLKGEVGGGHAVVGFLKTTPTEKGNDAFLLDTSSIPADKWPAILRFVEENYKPQAAVKATAASSPAPAANFDALLGAIGETASEGTELTGKPGSSGETVGFDDLLAATEG